jgi:hypothetical protein
MGKASLWRVPADHVRTLYDNRTGRPDWGSVVSQGVVPVVVGAGSWWSHARLTDVNAAVAGISIVAGLLFSMAVFLFQLRTSLRDDRRLGEQDYRLVDECMSNVLWAILLGLSLALYLIVCGAGGWIGSTGPGPVLTGIAVAAATHFLLVIAMCLKRLRRAYERIAQKKP